MAIDRAVIGADRFRTVSRSIGPLNARWSTRLIAGLVGALGLTSLSGPALADDPCARRAYAGLRYIVCSVDTRSVAVSVRWRREDGRPFGTLGALRASITKAGQTLLLATNGGMYDQDLAPVGYYVEDRQRLKQANTRRGFGNFHMLPNGVFFIERGRAGVMETRAFLRRNRRPDFATQSGPMLVINRRLHPRFNPKSTSRKFRNGVGVSANGRRLFIAISEEPVTFHAFAVLFRDGLKTPNALFLDGGSVPQLRSQTVSRASFAPVGPIVVVTTKPNQPRTGQPKADEPKTAQPKEAAQTDQ